jgi:predicted acylesterase/phospholipase RssA
LLSGALFLSAAAAAADRLTDCEASGREVVSVGLERRHAALVPSSITPERLTGAASAAGPCVAFAFGSDYQLLDWLENGKLDAAVLSPFAAELLRSAAVPGRTYFGFTTVWPLTGSAFPPRRLQIMPRGSRTADGSAADVYDRFILALGRTDEAPSVSIRLTSHLAAGLPLLIEYTQSRLETLAGEPGLSVAHFWTRFLDGLSFADDRPGAGEEADLVVRTRLAELTCPGVAQDVLLVPTCDSGRPGYRDVLVYSPKAGRVLFAGREGAPAPEFGRNIIGRWLDGMLDARSHPESVPLQTFLDANFGLHEIGFSKRRHFRFTLAELWDQFALAGTASGDAPFALVLTGGGVKAAYQTGMIDHLYGTGLLSNRKPPPGDDAIAVDYVVGTSGGALLGIFVSAIDEPAGLDLTQALWRNEAEDRYTASFDVFPIIEMPRYLSVIASILVFALVVFATRRTDRLRSTTIEATIPSRYRIVERLSTTFSPRLVWPLLVFVAPWVIKGVNGEAGLEHVPAIAGIFFSISVLIALYSDNRLIFQDSFTWGDLSLSGRQLFLLLAGLFLAVVPLINEGMGAFENPLLPLLGSYIGVGTLICCTGMVLVFFAVHRIYRSNHTVHVRDWLIPKAAATIIAVPVLAYLLLLLTGRPMFELNGEFWRYLLAYSAVVATGLILLARLHRREPAANPLTVGLDFLAADFPGRTYHITMKRYLRVMLVVTLAFLWWNIVMAPGIYGNEKAKEHFVGIYTKPACEARGLDETACRRLDLDTPLFIRPQVKFIVSATSLEQQREWYFLLHPEMLGEDCPDITSVESGERLNELEGGDPRWQIADCRLRNSNLVDIAFASGSPFPVFPATRVELPEEQADVWLVDGGYAHNIPIEAARAVAARRVLVLSSSPLHRQEAQQASRLEEQWLGNLSHNLTRLFPYLFERSQIEDKVSAENMFVATISPSLFWDPDKWPSLTDFRDVTVDRLISSAQADVVRRVGMVESWGPPVCRLGSAVFECAVVKAFQNTGGRD